MFIEPPTIAQQRAVAYAPKLGAIISFISSGYIVYHILFQEPHKRKRLYHRLVLAMNLAIMPQSLMYFWSTWAFPEETLYTVGAAGTIQTCTAQGFITIMMAQTVPFYYGSLSLQSYMAIKYKFQERNYLWIEKWVHLVAVCIPCALAIVPAVTENINPSASTCWIAKAPRGCEASDVPCARGEEISLFLYIFGLGQIALYFILPPSGVLAIYLWIRKTEKHLRGCSGMQLMRESARKKMLRSVAIQISVYLCCFWSTIFINLMHAAYQMLTGNIQYNLKILGNVLYSLQGFVLSIVYVTLEKIGRSQKVQGEPQSQLTVPAIRESAKVRRRRRSADKPEENDFNFHIFDGSTPDPNSPWARFIDCSEEEDVEESSPPELENEHTVTASNLQSGTRRRSC